MKVEMTEEEWATVLVALDGYGARKRIEWLDSRDDDDLTEAGSAEWCWQKIYGVLPAERGGAVKASLKGELPERFNNSVADAVGEGENPNNTASASVDPFGLPTRSSYENIK